MPLPTVRCVKGIMFRGCRFWLCASVRASTHTSC